MAFAWLLDPQHQIMTKSGTINVGGKIRVFDAATDDPVVTYKDFSGTANDEAITLDNNGRACIIADSARAYRVEVYDRYNTLLWTVTPVWCMASGGGIDNLVNIISSDGTVSIVKTSSGGITSFDLSIYPDNVDSSVVVARSATLSEDGTFQFTEAPIAKSGVLLDILGNQISAQVGWYHFDASVEVAYAGTPINQETPVVVTGPNCAEHISYDMSYPHTEYITVEGDYEIQSNWTPLSFAIQGMAEGMTAKVVNASVHEIIKEVGGFVQENADWDATSGVAEILHKPDLSVYATNAALTYGLAGKQDVIDDLDTIRSGAALGSTSVQPAEFNAALAQKQDTIPDLAAIRSGATAGASAVQPSDLANVATTGSYDDLNNRPNLTVYATKTEVNTGLAAKQDVISDLSAIRAGAQAGSTAVQPAALDSYATKVELNTGLSGKQDTINDLSTIRSGAAAGASAVQPSDLAPVATSGDYDDLSDKPDLSVYATTQAMNTALAGKQDTISDLSTIRSGAAAGATAIQPGDLATVATTGSYDDLSDKPTIPAAQVNSDWNSVSGVSQILNKPSLAAVATTGDYDDLVNKPSIPAAQVNADWNASSGVAEILNKPANLVQDANYVHTDENFTSAEKTKLSEIAAGAEVNVQADWTESDSSSDAYIANKPALATVATTGAYSDLTGTPTIPTVSDNVAKLQYGVATYAQVVAAFNAGKSIYLYNGDTDDGVVSSDITFGDDGSEIIFSRHNAYGAAGSRTEYKVTSSNVWSTTTKSVAVPTVDQSYSSSSANAQSGVAVAQAIAAIPSSSYTAGTGIDITNNVVSVDNTVVAMKSDLPTATSDLTNDSGFITLSDVPAQVQADWTESDTSDPSYIANKPSLATVATTGDYSDLSNTPTIPTVDQSYSASSANAQSGVAVASALANYTPTTSLATVATTGSYADLSNTPSIPTATSDLTNDSGFITLSDVPAQVNADWNSSSGASEILNKPTIPSGTQLVPAATSADADKVLTVDAQGTPAWASAQAPISAGDGVEITNNVVSAKVDGTTVTFNASGELQAAAAVTVDQTYNAASTNAQSGTAVAQAVATKEDVFDVGTGLEMDTSGSTPTLQVEAPVDIVAGPGIVVDNPDGNTLRVSVAQAEETVLYDANGSPNQTGPWTLSEVRTNFKWIDIVLGTDASGNEVKVQRFKADSPYMKVDINRYDEDPNWKISTMTLTFNQTTMSIKPNSIARYMISIAGSVSTSTAAAQAPFIYQVIGVGRIASN